MVTAKEIVDECMQKNLHGLVGACGVWLVQTDDEENLRDSLVVGFLVHSRSVLVLTHPLGLMFYCGSSPCLVAVIPTNCRSLSFTPHRQNGLAFIGMVVSAGNTTMNGCEFTDGRVPLRLEEAATKQVTGVRYGASSMPMVVCSRHHQAHPNDEPCPWCP